MTKKPKQDKNFDTLIDRFQQKVYGTAKGDWRLKLLREDLEFFYRSPKALSVWDAGCGFAQISLELAQHKHQLTLCDLSAKMLARAEASFQSHGLSAKFHHSAAQTLAPTLPQFDLVLCHAVAEWLAEPLQTLNAIAGKVKPGGALSLLFYNRNAMVYTNTLKGGWRLRHVLNNSYLGQGDKLTPPNPLYPHELAEQLGSWGFSIVAHTGIRVFYDYIDADRIAQTNTDELFELEHRYCRLPTYRDMGRYVHYLAQKTDAA